MERPGFSPGLRTNICLLLRRGWRLAVHRAESVDGFDGDREADRDGLAGALTWSELTSPCSSGRLPAWILASARKP